MSDLATVPPGFTPHFRKSPLTDPWEPLYSRRTEAGLDLGLVIAAAHTNSRGFAHGGMISALADNGMGLACGPGLAEDASVITVSLAVDFLGAGRIGQWLEVACRATRVGTTLCFAEAVATADGEPCARAHATFRVIRKAA
ncbi:MAG TPA: PaaI family thioesterase [Caulobacteraceae bacterium]|nr:PaaI family thioesterase [Caulobacteraceae bacterium]